MRDRLLATLVCVASFVACRSPAPTHRPDLPDAHPRASSSPADAASLHAAPAGPLVCAPPGVEAGSGRGLAAGASHTCARCGDGRVVCWGSNARGQLGDESTEPRSAPVAVHGLGNVVELVAGTSHSCARTREGRVTCWGDNARGQLGTATEPTRYGARTVALTGTVTQLAAGGDRTCARRVDGTVVCWGAAPTAAVPAQPEPLTLPDMQVVAGLAVRGDELCAFDDVGRVQCRVVDRLASHTPPPNATVGATAARVIELSFTDRGLCALRTDGSVDCLQSPLGRDGSFIVAGPSGFGEHPSLVGMPSGLGAATQLAGGSDHLCALQRSGEVRCRGLGSQGQLGNGTFTDDERGAAPVLDLLDAIELASGTHHSCARRREGAFVCWGANEGGQLGDGTRGAHRDATLAARVPGAVRLAVGHTHLCALTEAGAVWCGGQATYGQLGRGDDLRAEMQPVPGLADVTLLAASAMHTCARRRDGTTLCWGANNMGQSTGTGGGARTVPTPIPWARGALALGLEGANTCAALEGSVRCWGAQYGAVVEPVGWFAGGGRAPRSPTDVPAPHFSTVEAQRSVVALGVGEQHGCALERSGTVRCWGDDTRGQLGNGLAAAPARPLVAVAVAGPTDASSLAVGRWHSCVARRDGTVACWGPNPNGQLGLRFDMRFTAREPLALPGLRDVVQVVASQHSSCARRRDGTVLCWGLNALQRADREGGEVVAAVEGATGAVDLALGSDRFGCMLRADGDVLCWGSLPLVQGRPSARAQPTAVRGLGAS